MSNKDFTPKKVVDDDSKGSKERGAARSDVYSSTSPEHKKYIDHYIDRRDQKIKELGDAENDLDKAVKTRSGGKMQTDYGMVDLPIDLSDILDLDK